MVKLNEIVYLIDGQRKNRSKFRRLFSLSSKEKEKRLYENKIKYMFLADMKLNRLTLQKIAKKQGVTSERIRQILKQYFSDIDFYSYRKK